MRREREGQDSHLLLHPLPMDLSCSNCSLISSCTSSNLLEYTSNSSISCLLHLSATILSGLKQLIPSPNGIGLNAAASPRPGFLDPEWLAIISLRIGDRQLLTVSSIKPEMDEVVMFGVVAGVKVTALNGGVLEALAFGLGGVVVVAIVDVTALADEGLQGC